MASADPAHVFPLCQHFIAVRNVQEYESSVHGSPCGTVVHAVLFATCFNRSGADLRFGDALKASFEGYRIFIRARTVARAHFGAHFLG